MPIDRGANETPTFISFDLNIIYWNACGLNGKYTEFLNFLNTNNVHVALVCETWLKPSDKLRYSKNFIVCTST